MNNKMLTAIFLLKISFSCFGISCDEEIAGVVNEKNLRSEGESMEHFKTYDQGAIGSCASNALGTALYSMHRVQVSPNQLHTNYYSRNPKKKKANIMSGANACSTLAYARGLKRICAAKTVRLDEDTRGGINNSMQAMGSLYSSMYGEFWPEEHRMSKEDGILALESIRSKMESSKEILEDICDGYARSNITDNGFVNELNRLNDNSNDENNGFYNEIRNTIAKINSFIVGDSDVGLQDIGLAGDNRGEDKIRQKLKEQIGSACISTSCEDDNLGIYGFFSTDDVCIANNSVENCRDLSGDIQQNLFKSYQGIKNNTLNGDEVLDLIIGSPSLKSSPLIRKILYRNVFQDGDVKKDQEKIKQMIQEDLKRGYTKKRIDLLTKQNEEYCEEYKKDEINKILFLALDEQTETQPGGEYCDNKTEFLITYIESLLNIPNSFEQFNSIDKMVDWLNRSEDLYSVFSQTMIDHQECKKSGNHIASHQLKYTRCDETSFGPKENLEPEAQANFYKNKFNKVISSSLDAGRATVFYACTGFFYDENFSINNDVDRCQTARRHGKHAMAVIGNRCKDGKIQYLVQNSWGNECYYYTNKQLDCQESQGNFWVDEDVLVPNIYHISKIGSVLH